MHVSFSLSCCLRVNKRGRETVSYGRCLQGMSLRTKASGGGHCGYSLAACVCLYRMCLCNVSIYHLLNILTEFPPPHTHTHLKIRGLIPNTLTQKFISVCICVYLCTLMCMCVHVHRQTGCQAIVTTWQQPTAFHFWLCQALQLQKQALPEAPSFRLNRWDGWATSSDIHPPAFLVVHLPPCSPGQLDSYQRS